MKKGINVSGINLAIKLAKEYGYINDETFARNFVSQYSNKSKRELKNKLYLKGINKNIIDEVVNDIDPDKEIEVAGRLAEKYMRNKTIDKKSLSNLYSYLLRKGFDNSCCMNIIKKYKCDIEDL